MCGIAASNRDRNELRHEAHRAPGVPRSADPAGVDLRSTMSCVPGLGDAAFAESGFIDVLKGSVAVRITAPLATAAQVETLARNIVG
jgi:hypothetical protein